MLMQPSPPLWNKAPQLKMLFDLSKARQYSDFVKKTTTQRPGGRYFGP